MKLYRIGAMMVAGGMLLSVAPARARPTAASWCDTPVDLPGLNLAPPKPAVPSWMKFKSAKPEPVGPEFSAAARDQGGAEAKGPASGRQGELRQA